MIAEEIIKKLELIAHPEGGYYSETYRSEIEIPGRERCLMTSIYFLLTSENVSKFHRIQSDELWYFHSGSPLYVHTLDENGHQATVVGNDVINGEKPQFLVKKNTIFGSSVVEKNSFSLVSCAVAPGFDFNDFELFTAEQLLNWFPHQQKIINQLT